MFTLLTFTFAKRSIQYRKSTVYLQTMMATFEVVTMRGGLEQVVIHHAEVYYCKGTQRLVIPTFDDQKLMDIGQFDGVHNDRYAMRTVHEASGDQCAEYRVFKQ